MIQTDVLVVGASVAGLASAASLQKQGVNYLVIEKQRYVAAPWRNHYHRLHLHTNKSVSHLPYSKFGSNVPRYPTRDQVVAYLEEYQRAFNIEPLFNTEATAITYGNNSWVTETNDDTIESKYVIMATGVYGKPRPMHFKGMETFPGRLLHSCEYKTGKDFKGERVLVVGFGNSACEIAIDLCEQGAQPAMSVRSPVNIIPRDVMGIPILELAQFMSRLPPRVADTINAPLMRLLVGNTQKLGLKKKRYGPFEEIRRDRTIPVLDIGTVKHIRKGNIKLYDGIEHIEGSTVHFSNGDQKDFDAIVACIGFDSTNAAIVAVDQKRFEDLRVPTEKQKFFGTDGLYFCGFWLGPRGHIREIASDAQKIAKDIARKERLVKT